METPRSDFNRRGFGVDGVSRERFGGGLMTGDSVRLILDRPDERLGGDSTNLLDIAIAKAHQARPKLGKNGCTTPKQTTLTSQISKE